MVLMRVVGIGEAGWKFKTSFNVMAERLSEQCADIVFEGLDTYCDIYLVRLSTMFTLVLISIPLLPVYLLSISLPKNPVDLFLNHVERQACRLHRQHVPIASI